MDHSLPEAGDIVKDPMKYISFGPKTIPAGGSPGAPSIAFR